MAKYELSLSPDYVADWNHIEAIRELFQNAIDQQATNKDNEMMFAYDGVDTLTIGNKLSVLEPNTLLLGGTSKANDNSTIGKYGEGYKLAALVLTRLGKQMTIYNYGRKEIWTPRFSKSRKYGSEILVFDVKSYVFSKVPHHNLTITVEDICEDEWLEIRECVLQANEDLGDTYQGDNGSVLLESKYKGRIYTGGLYVCTLDMDYGYNFNPGILRVDRDRKMARSFDVEWEASRLWNSIAAVGQTKMISLINSNASDTRFVNNIGAPSSIRSAVHTEFRNQYGTHAIPVTSHSEMEEIKEKYVNAVPVIVNDSQKQLITSSSAYAIVAEEKTEEESGMEGLIKRYDMWYSEIRGQLSYSKQVAGDALLSDIVDSLQELEELKGE